MLGTQTRVRLARLRLRTGRRADGETDRLPYRLRDDMCNENKILAARCLQFGPALAESASALQSIDESQMDGGAVAVIDDSMTAGLRADSKTVCPTKEKGQWRTPSAI